MYATLCGYVMCLCLYDWDIVCSGICHFLLHCLFMSVSFSFRLRHMKTKSPFVFSSSLHVGFISKTPALRQGDYASLKVVKCLVI